MPENGTKCHEIHPFLQRGFTVDGVRLGIFARCCRGHYTSLFCGYYCGECGVKVIEPYLVIPVARERYYVTDAA